MLQGNTITNNTTGVIVTAYAYGSATLTGNVISNNNGAGVAVPEAWRNSALHCVVASGAECLDFGPRDELRRRLLLAGV